MKAHSKSVEEHIRQVEAAQERYRGVLQMYLNWWPIALLRSVAEWLECLRCTSFR